MKNFLKLTTVAIGLLFAAPAIAAPFATMQYEFQNTEKSVNDRSGYVLTIGDKVYNFLTADVTAETFSTTTQKQQDNRVEGGLTANTPIYGPFGAYVRVAVGDHFVSGIGATYYSIEPGLTADLPAGFTGTVGYRYRDSFQSNLNTEHTNTIRVGLAHQVYGGVYINAGYDRAFGDQRYDQFSGGLSVKF